MTICEKCGQDYGSCDLDTHLAIVALVDTRYGFDMNNPVETPFFKESDSPRLSEPYEHDGTTVALVAAVVYEAQV